MCASRREAMNDSKEEIASCFVIKTDGETVRYNKLELVTKIYQAPHLLADGKERIFPSEISAYQTPSHFAIFAGSFTIGGYKSNLAVETLPGFAVRIAKGNLNVYVKKYKVNQSVADEFYFQQGNGPVYPYSPELMDALIKNVPEALAFYNTYKRSLKKSSELKLTAQIYNDAYFQGLASNTRKKKKISP